MVVLGVELVQMIQQHLRVVIHVGLSLREQVHGRANTFTRGSFGDASLALLPLLFTARISEALMHTGFIYLPLSLQYY